MITFFADPNVHPPRCSHAERLDADLDVEMVSDVAGMVPGVRGAWIEATHEHLIVEIEYESGNRVNAITKGVR